MLTHRQKEVYTFLKGYIDRHGVAPTYEVIRHHFGFRSYNAVFKHLKQLEARGYLTSHWKNKKQAFSLKEPVQASIVYESAASARAGGCRRTHRGLGGPGHDRSAGELPGHRGTLCPAGPGRFDDRGRDPRRGPHPFAQAGRRGKRTDRCGPDRRGGHGQAVLSERGFRGASSGQLEHEASDLGGGEGNRPGRGGGVDTEVSGLRGNGKA